MLTFIKILMEQFLFSIKMYYIGNVINGMAVINITGLNVGNYTLHIIYSESNNYIANSKNFTFTVNKKSTSITANPCDFVINYGGLYDVIVNPKVSGVNVLFTLNGKVIGSTITNELGIASIQLTSTILKNIGSGTHNIIVSFEGNENYFGFKATTKLSLNKELTKLSNVKSVKKTYKSTSKNMQLTSTLKDSKNKAIKNQLVYFKVNNKKIYKVKTNSKGIAKLTLNKADIKVCNINKKGNYKFTVTYKTTETYKQSTKNGKLKVLK